MNRVRLRGFLLLLCLLSISAQASEMLTWTGCGIVKKAFMKELSDAYMEKSGEIMMLTATGATRGIRSVANGQYDIGGSCRHKLSIPEEENAHLHHVAWDALVFVVNRDNPIESITFEHLRKIYRGEITNWKEIGGHDQLIQLYTRRGKINGVGYMLRKLIFNDPDFNISPRAKRVKTSAPLEVAIARNRWAAGITGSSSAHRQKNTIKMLSIDGVFPSKKNVASGKYPYFRPLYLVTHPEPEEKIAKFLNFAFSPEGQAVISSQGTVNLDEGKRTLFPRFYK
jgi:phosphate transport system substrate-binding protein